MAIDNSPIRGALDDRENEAFVTIDGKFHKAVLARPDPNGDAFPVSFSEGSSVLKSPYGEVIALASGVETTLVSYTVPALKKSFLQRVEYGGENIALYRVKLNGVLISKARTWFTGDLNGSMIWQQSALKGYPIVAADVLTVTVIHTRSSAGDFESRLVLVEDNA